MTHLPSSQQLQLLFIQLDLYRDKNTSNDADLSKKKKYYDKRILHEIILADSKLGAFLQLLKIIIAFSQERIHKRWGFLQKHQEMSN